MLSQQSQGACSPSGLVRGESVRTLRKLEIVEGETGAPLTEPLHLGVVLDVETTGRDPVEDQIIELALRRFLYSEDGQVVRIGRLFSWREDPGQSLDSTISKLTGIQNSDLVGQRIDDAEVIRLLSKASMIIAHNAAFDRPFLEKRLPDLNGLAWCCSMTEGQWLDWGFDGRTLGWLVAQAGWFFEGHRAGNDVDALLALIMHVLPEDQTILSHLARTVADETYRFEATGAPFAVKDRLRSHGYRWNAAKRVWWKDISSYGRFEEEAWLCRQVYCHDGGLMAGPTIERLTAKERYR